MLRVRLIHWKPEEAGQRISKIEKAGFAAEFSECDTPTWKEIRSDPPDAILVDLSRLPSHGREVAIMFRDSKKTRHIPIVFVDGAEDKIEKVKSSLPDAVYTSWSRIKSALNKAIANPPTSPITPKIQMNRGVGTPLTKKLDIKENSTVVLINAPGSFESTLGHLPTGAKLKKSNRGKRDMTIWFVTETGEFLSRLNSISEGLCDNPLWIAYPKKTSKIKSDLTQALVRETPLNIGLVDYKVCAIDQDWTGLKFSWRRN